KSPQKSNTASLVGNPAFYSPKVKDRAFTDLPGTAMEVNEVRQLLASKGWNASMLTETSATEEQVKSVENPKIFHIATHGFYSPAVEKNIDSELTETESQLSENPLMKSGLLLKGGGDILSLMPYNYNAENGVLTAYEAMSLNLDQTDLVVLSACETGAGEISNGEGVYGLQRAFLVAGAKMLIMSLFKVDDDATQSLIRNFYERWLQTGNMRLSLINAKKDVRKELPDPLDWGSFMMIGLE
ncbi:MAG: CHAT domain-containing protein, partial [Bacteroidota bacterium]